MKTIYAKALRLVKAFRKGKREVPEGTKNLKAFAQAELNGLVGDDDQVSDQQLIDLLLDHEWVAEAGQCELATGIPFFAVAVSMYRELGGSAPHLEMRIVKVHDRVAAAVFKVINDGFEVTSPGMPKLRVRSHKARGTFSGLGAAHGAVYATMEYKTPAEAFSRIVYLCWASQRVL